MLKRKSKDETYAIIGLGRFGQALALSLAESGCEVVAIDRDETAVRNVRDKVEQAYICEELTVESMKSVGIQNCDTVVVCVGSMLDVSILTTLRVVSLGVNRVIAKATNSEHGEILAKMGAEVVYPEREMALRLAQRLSAKSAIEYINLSVDIEIAEFEVDELFVGRTIIEIDMRRKYKLNIIAIQNDGNVTTSINPQYVVQENDVIVVIGKGIDVARFTASL